MDLDIASLAISLARLESEDKVICLLKEKGLWNKKENWKPFGGNEDNFSTIGNQQSSPIAALVEKLINSVDALLMKECYIKGINPESPDAPQSIKEALVNFFHIRDGKLSNLDTKNRTKMSFDIILAASGSKQNPNYTIVDCGEGQTPKRMPNTILSLPMGKSNKLKIPFVQGKFNMGGTGVFQFCGQHNIQIIITRKCPNIECIDDETKDQFGVTVIRRETPSEGKRSSMYTYLSDHDGIIMSFNADNLNIVPDCNGQYRPFSHGMYIKMFDYNIPGLRSAVTLDLYYRLALLLPGLAQIESVYLV